MDNVSPLSNSIMQWKHAEGATKPASLLYMCTLLLSRFKWITHFFTWIFCWWDLSFTFCCLILLLPTTNTVNCYYQYITDYDLQQNYSILYHGTRNPNYVWCTRVCMVQMDTFSTAHAVGPLKSSYIGLCEGWTLTQTPMLHHTLVPHGEDMWYVPSQALHLP